MAQEVTLRKGYTFAVDVWAIGVLLFELLTGKAPFGKQTRRDIKKSQEST